MTSAAVQAGDLPTLFDVLPIGGDVVAADWVRRDFDIDLPHSIVLAGEPIAPTDDGSLALCAALALVEARLTGADRVVATWVGADGVRQASIDVPRSGWRDDWYAHFHETMVEASDARLQHEWMVATTAAQARVGQAPCSLACHWQWTDATSSRLAVSYRAPATAMAIECLVRCVSCVLTTLRAPADRRLVGIDAVDPGARQRLVEWNTTSRPRRATDTVHDLFAARARAYPQDVAVCAGDRVLSYGALDARAERVGAALCAAGVLPGQPVAVLLERSPEAVVAILGILKAGACYLPLEPSWPPERLAFAIDDARAVLAIGDPALASLVSPPVRTLAALEACGVPFAPPPGDGASLAYVMYTSGSTGIPKGVEIPHWAIVRLVRDVDYVDFGAKPRVLHAAPLGFDASTFELWGALLNGGVCVVHTERVPSALGLAATLARHRPRIAWLTAALFNAIVDEDADALRGLEQLLIGGEALSVPHVRRAYAALPDVQLINGYGPTECTTFAATLRIPRELAGDVTAIPIGRPIADTTLHVLNPRGEPVPVGVLGELHIGGAGLARGYLGRPELTAERFVTPPGSNANERVYRTGDLVRWQPDGTVAFVGRADQQVKLRGYRIELGEIEHALLALPGVRAAAVLVREDRPGDRRLVAYHVADGGAPLPAHVLRAALAQRLPDYMVPVQYLALDALPVTANGKLDRHALPTPGSARPDLAEAYAPAIGPLEAALCNVFGAVLGVEPVGRQDNFFDLGGTSLLAARAIARVHAELSDAASLVDFFGAPTPAALAALIDGRTAAASTPATTPAPERGADARAAPVAIVAMAGRFPGANDVEGFWRNLCEGRESITFFGTEGLDASVPAEQHANPDYVAARGVIEGVEWFDAGFFGISPREAELMDPQQRIFLELCWECLERGGYVPDAQEAPVGVFGGMHNATYFQRHLQAQPALIDKLGAFQVMLANEKDYLATRVAHKLNLTGPAISLNTACSTSLVAIAQAVRALRAGDCAMALAGGVSVTCPPRSGYLTQEGSMLSPDGHTRSFDAQARGTVFSDGAAVVLLKRLDEALRDGDPVIAVIRGVAVNNDGGAKASFTAPNAAGQAAVITRALADAQVPARSISYVEAHGTATPLGDPIEIDGLTRAFRQETDACGFCAIGSVKSNVGHLVMAAGVAGVIKTALALHQRQLPPSLHFSAANPAIDLAASPFVVADALRAWAEGDTPRRAGVSSFGVGGTNAHVILEQAPERLPSEPAQGPQLLLLSARTPEALARARADLAAHLDITPAANLADVAYTLERGRKRFAQRCHVVASNLAEAAARLRDEAPNVRTAMQPSPSVVFLFPGQGAQYAGMGRALHATEPAFRDALDACTDALRDDLGFDLRTRLFDDDAQALRTTAVTQPALFAIEYALAQLWMSHGVRPAALVGHSVGEFVAAVLAGVMRLEEGACLVARRGKLMQAQPAGAMLSVRLDGATLARRLPPALSLAAENAPCACVVAGTHDDIAAFASALERDGVAHRLLHTSHAFHSAMMEPALAPFGREVGRVNLAVPRIPIHSTLSGRRLGDDDAVSIDYWTRHLRHTVRFSQALQPLLDEPGHVFLEVGPRATLGALARQHAGARDRVVAASLGASADGERTAWLHAMGQLWSAGVPVATERLDRRARRQRVRLPTYPFERRRHWIDASAAPSVTPVVDAGVHPIDLPVAAIDAAAPAVSTDISAIALESAMATSASPAHAAGIDRPARLVAQLVALFEDVSGSEFDGADPSASFVELGLDSLSLTQVALQLQKTFALKITFRELMEACPNFDRLARHIDRLLPPDAPSVAAPVTTAPATATSSALPDMPAMAALAPSGNLVQDVIQQQMAIMQQQLALLTASGGAAAPASAPVVAAVSAPLAVASPVVPAVVDAAPTDEEATVAHTTYDVKKAFGAIARIHAGGTELTERQRVRLEAFMRRYIERTAKSKAYTAEHRGHLADPRVVNGFRPLLKEMIYQIVVERSKGSRVWDLDGNEYVDALNGFGMNLFGWQPDFVLDAVRAQLDAGYEIGPQHPLAGEVARQVCKLTGFDRAALCNTGSEAVMGTVRIARTITGRDTLVIFAGAYHGIFDEVIVRGTKKLRSVPAAPGILRNTADNVLVLDYGTPESLAIIRERAASIAAVLVEPVQSRRPDFQPKEFLQELRAITDDAGALLIFDEVVTGFRAHPRGAQEVLGIDADLAAYGKVVGGGFPIGVIAGKRKYMDALDGGGWQYGDTSIPTVGVTYFAGTFVRHPLALAAAHAVLAHLEHAGPQLQERLNARTGALMDELNAFCVSVGAPIKLAHFASVWKVGFTEEHPLQDLLFAMMRSRGVHVLDNFPCFFTTAHAEADFVAIAKAFKDSVLELQEAEFLPRRRNAPALAIDAAHPPVAGARLGRDADGRPAWFVPNPDSPGKYLRVGT